MQQAELLEQLRAEELRLRAEQRLRQVLHNPAEFLTEQARAINYQQLYREPPLIIQDEYRVFEYQGIPRREPEDPDEDMPDVEDQE